MNEKSREVSLEGGLIEKDLDTGNEWAAIL
jgi:hypothetical protein